MEPPIRLLWSNIVDTFENIDPSSLTSHLKAINSEKIAKTICYCDKEEKVRTPFANLETREINVQETYLSHLWSFIYSIFVMYEEGVQKRLIDETFDGNLNFDTPLLQNAKKLFDWSISLTRQYSEWNENLPNPKNHKNCEEKFYAERVNSFFKFAVAYLMFHEFAHLTQGHDSFFLGIKKSDLSKKDFAERIQIENEADLFAYNKFNNENDSCNLSLTKKVSILSVICSALFIVSNVEGVKQETHPDLDHRMLHFLQHHKFDTKSDEFYCYYLCCVVLRLFLLEHKIELNTVKFDCAEDALNYYLDELEKLKP